MTRRVLHILMGVCLLFSGELIGQVSATTYSTTDRSILGYSGLLIVPTGRIVNERSFSLGAGYFSRGQTVLDASADRDVGEHVFFATVGFLSILEINVKLIRPNDIKDNFFGIGDRSYAARLNVLRQERHGVDLSFGVSDWLAEASYLHSIYVVGSRTFALSENPSWTLLTNLGYGNSVQDTRGNYLQGIFGGVSLNWRFLQSLLEYDGERWNAGLGVRYREWFALRCSLLALRQFGGSLSVSFKL